MNNKMLHPPLAKSPGTFSLTVPGPVDSADTLDGQGGPRSRSKPLQEKEFRTTYRLSVHC